MSRRNLLGGLAALAVTPVASRAAPPMPPSTPDAELIRLCAEHPAHIHAVNHGPEDEEGGPIWDAYEHSAETIHNAKPLTMAGLIAKAKAARAEALKQDGSESPENTLAANWAWDLVNDLLRLEGGA